jgi:hypothetical protein
MLRKFKLFNRFPRLVWKEGEKPDIVEPGAQGQYPELAADFEPRTSFVWNKYF